MEPMDVEQSVESSCDSWRLRDAANEIVQDRVPKSPMMFTLSHLFDVDTCLARLRRDKAVVVRDSFGVAAQCVMRATETQDDDKDTKQNLGPVDEALLSPVIQQWKELQDMKDASMTRALDNKGSRKVKSSDAASSVGASKSQKSDTKKSSSDIAVAVPTVTNPAAATMESRNALSRAVLCTAASIAFDELTPAHQGHDIDVQDLPQNVLSPAVTNMGAVLLQAQTLGKRAASLAENAARRSRQRYEYRRDNAEYQKDSSAPLLKISNPYGSKQSLEEDDEDEEVDEDEAMTFAVPMASEESVTEEFKTVCLPRLMSVLDKGSGHAVYCDVEWPTRHGRIAHLLEQLADKTRGPHLIVTTKPEVEAFAQEFHSVDDHLHLISRNSQSDDLRVLTYTGSKAHRRKLRQHFTNANGLKDSSFHIMVTSYSVFIKDYLHLCQLPYQVVILDDGWSWLAAAHVDSNSSIGTLWDQSIFSANDQHIGLAGTMQLKEWDFMDDDFSEERVKSACIGLTARHRILTTPSMHLGPRDFRLQGPMPGLVGFLLPQFADVVREEWDRSRIATDVPSMEHVRKLVTRSIVVHHPTGNQQDLYQLAIDGISGGLPHGDRSYDPKVPDGISDEFFVSDGKVSQSRRGALTCFGMLSTSWMRYELGRASFQGIMDAMQRSTSHGHVCEEVVTASSMTSSGANGTISGTMAYRLAVRCGRTFGSEQGLRQHMAAMHAPPGTWLCRTCGSDCGTSPARTHHERTCGQPPVDEGGSAPPGGASTARKGAGPTGKHLGPVGVVGKKGTAKKKSESSAGDSTSTAAGRGLETMGGGASSVVPALSVINIKDLPKDVKPLLRDPRQTSRTGGNAKRHIYAYRGVCRQARKGHDRWQSQISFGGTNHYLGTFDSEWDAAAIYAWAHLILYGEEATKKAQKEGEEAAAAYEQEKKDIAAGKIIEPPPKGAKAKRKKGEKKSDGTKSPDKGADNDGKTPGSSAKKQRRKRAGKDTAGSEKKSRASPKGDMSSIAPILAKGVAKVPILGPRKVFEANSDLEMMQAVAVRVEAARMARNYFSDANLRPCVSLYSPSLTPPSGGAILLGLSSLLFGWNVDAFLASQDFDSVDKMEMVSHALQVEYDSNGYNESFRTVVQGGVCVIGRASMRTERAWKALGLGELTVGSTVGELDCNIGGCEGSCSEAAATIAFCPSGGSDFQFCTNNDTDVVTLNGQQVKSSMGSFPLFNEDVCTVGSRVFVFLLPTRM